MMMKVKISDFIDGYGDGIHGTPKYDDDGEYYFINGNNLSEGEIVIDNDTLAISKEEYERIKRPLNENTLLLSINGTLGYISEYHDEKIALGKSVCYLNLKRAEDKDFIKYVLSSKLFHKYIQNVASGSTIKNLAPSQVAEYEFQIPENTDTKRVAAILKSLDEKIKLNNKLISELESLTKTIYDYWFLQFEFPNEEGKPYKSSGGKMIWSEELKREIPEGWGVGKLRDRIFFEYGSALKETDRIHGDFPVMGSNGVIGWHNKWTVQGPGIIVGRKGSVGMITLEHMNFYPIDTTYYVTLLSADEEIFYYYQLLKTLRLDKLNSDSAVPGLNRDIALDRLIHLSPSQIIKKYNDIVSSFYNKTALIKIENKSLGAIRDYLLPMLMNGQVGFKE